MQNKKNISKKSKLLDGKDTQNRPAKNFERILADSQAMYKASHSLVKMENSQEVLQKTADFVANILHVDRITVITLDIEEEKILGFYKSGVGQNSIEIVSYSELNQGLTGWVLKERKPALSLNGELDKRESSLVQKRRTETNCGSIMVVPLLYKEKIIGTMTAINRIDQRDFTEEDVDLMMMLANQAAVVIENNRLYQNLLDEVELRKSAEAELEGIKEHLEHLVQDRTSELKKANKSLELEKNEKQETERALRESEARYRELFDRATDAIFVSDSTGRYTDVNYMACSMLGYSQRELLGKKILDLIPAEELAKDPLKLSELREGKQIVRERNLLRKDGSLLAVEISSSMLPDGRLLGMVRDITERKKVDDLLRKSQANLETAQALAHLGSWELDIHTGTGSWSKEMFNLFQRDPVLGIPPLSEFLEMVHPEDRDSLMKGQGHAVETGNHVTIEYRGNPDMGLDCYFQATLHPILDVHGNFLHMAGTVLDITERKQIEERILNINLELEHRVEERTRQLVAANKELESFSYSVSHDLRAPLRAIDGFTRILVEDYEPLLDDEGKRVCRVIGDEAKRMGTLIDDLLNFSRLSRTVVNMVPVKMTELARKAFESFTVKAEIDFRVSQLPEMVGDASLLYQVWINLIGNSIKFTSKKERPVIEVDCVRNEVEDIYSVRDNGAGFDMEYANKLFGVFQRLHSEDEFEGTGVGLAIVQRVVHRHGGRVWAEGEPGIGATFYFSIPKENGYGRS